MAQAMPLVFQGSAKDQALAERIFDLMTRTYGSLYASDALVRQSVANLATFLAQENGATAEELQKRIDNVIKKNSTVFGREERAGEIFVSTSRSGHAVARGADTVHTFRDRLYEPARPLPVDDLDNIVTTVRQTIPVSEPVLISSFWRGAPTQTPEFMAPVEEQYEEVGAPVVEQVVAQPPVVSAEPVVPTTSVVLSDGTRVDLTLPLEQMLADYGVALQAELRAALDDDPLKRVVNFGDRFYVADALPNFGKNDLRRIRDFIVEQGQPVADATILTDLYRERPNNPNFEMVRFALDYRLAREKDFEFVGMPGANLWSAKGLAPIGGKRLKASDLGQLFAYLQDGYDDSTDDAGGDLVMHTLTYFEWEYGILPFNDAFAALLPQPLLDDQRTAVIRIEASQHYASYLCEVRYPTGARGGWIWGLEEFLREYVVPGVSLSFAPTQEPNVFTIAYDEAPGTEAKLLHFDEKRNRFAFMPVTYYAAVDERQLPSQAQYNKLRNLKSLPIAERKKADVVLTHVFEIVGEQLGSKEEPLYWIQFDELYLAVNVLRPISRAYLTQLLGADDTFYADETTLGAWYFKPVPEKAVEVDEPDEEESVLSYDEDDE